ncbi:MAG: hypothetical protein IJ208_04060 [Butyrivibrio sp.]|nr:hypothetical protein [Butyrivibrio sp.]
MDVNEKDWKLFRKYLPDWQENYMETKKCKEVLTCSTVQCSKYNGCLLPG